MQLNKVDCKYQVILVPVLLFIAWVVPGCSKDTHVESVESGNSEDRLGETNLARSARYTFSTEPNYPLTLDADDAVQLTDGRLIDRRLWTDPGAVGWQNKDDIRITIDLRGPARLSRVKLRHPESAKSDIFLPRAVLVYGQLEESAYQLIGDFVPSIDQPQQESGSEEWNRDFDLPVEGVYDRLVINIVPNGAYVFLDEIEILGAPSSSEELSIGKTQARAGTTPVSGENELLSVDSYLTSRGTRTRSLLDLDTLSRILSKGSSAELQSKVSDQTTKAESFFDNWDPGTAFETLYPQNEFHRELFGLQGLYWQESGMEDVRVWEANRWESLDPFELPGKSPGVVSLQMGLNEIRSVAFNLSSPVDTSFTIDIPEMSSVEMSVLEGKISDTADFQPVTSLLEPVTCDGSSCRVDLFAGLTTRIWLQANTHRSTPGDYVDYIMIGSDPLRFELTVYPVDIQAGDQLALSGWDYPESRYYGVTDDNVDAFVQLLKEYGVSTTWGVPRTLDKGEYDSDGRMTRAPDPTVFESWISKWPDAKGYAIYVAVQDRFSGFDPDTKQFHSAVGEWIEWWGNWIDERGIDRDKILLLLVDEPGNREASELFLGYRDAIASAAPEITILENPVFANPKDARSIIEYSDTVMPLYNVRFRSLGKSSLKIYADVSKSNDKELWIYSIGQHGALTDPYYYYRMQSWAAWDLGATGSAYWSFGGLSKNTSWNEYANSRYSPSPLFLDAGRIKPSVQLEAMREGAFDYALFSILRVVTDKTRKLANTDDIIRESDDVFATEIPRLLEQIPDAQNTFLDSTLDRTNADEIRVAVLQLITRMQNVDDE